jgi:formaldehyde-activating enzyme involved in methanogenesis
VKHESVIYRLSETSVTFRCERCKLQWTITLANMHKTLTEVVAVLKEGGATDEAEVYENFARITKFAVEREQARKSSIQRVLQNPLTRRHVIRLPDSR